MNIKPTQYGYIQSRTYRNPEFFHENVAHFTTDLATLLFAPISTSQIRTAPSQCCITECTHGKHLPGTIPRTISHPQSICQYHNREMTSFEQYYPTFDPNLSHFAIHYESHQNNTNPLHQQYQQLSHSQDLQHYQPQSQTQQHRSNTLLDNSLVSTQCLQSTEFGTNIVYIGQDQNIMKIKMVIAGDQNAGKSTFLYSLTNPSDPSFLLLNRYLPIIQGNFYNCRVLPTSQHRINADALTTPSSNHSDELPMLDSDIGITQLFLTNDDLSILLEDYMVGNYDEISKKKPCSYQFENIFAILPYSPHVCIELVELGGDHLDRLAQHHYHTHHIQNGEFNLDNSTILLRGVSDLYRIITEHDRHIGDNHTDDTFLETIDTLLKRTMSLLNPSQQHQNQQLPPHQPFTATTLSYFSNLSSLCSFNQKTVNIREDDDKDHEINSTVAKIHPKPFILLITRILLLQLTCHFKPKNETSPLDLFLLRSPLSAYDPTDPHIQKNMHPFIFESSSNAYLRQHIHENNNDVQSDVMNSDQLSLFGPNELELPMKPYLHTFPRENIDNLIVYCQSMVNDGMNHNPILSHIQQCSLDYLHKDNSKTSCNSVTQLNVFLHEFLNDLLKPYNTQIVVHYALHAYVSDHDAKVQMNNNDISSANTHSNRTIHADPGGILKTLGTMLHTYNHDLVQSLK